MEFKYVIVKHRGMECPILFSKFLSHDDFLNHSPISAGFVSIHKPEKETMTSDGIIRDIEFVTYGKSVSLQLNSRPEDAKIIERDYEFRV